MSTGTTSSPTPATAPASASTPGDGGRWYVTQTSATTGPQLAFAAVAKGDGWVDDAGAPLPEGYGYGMRTQSSTVAKIKPGRPVVAQCGEHWYLLVARKLDEQARTIHVGVDGNNVCPVDLGVDHVRVIVEVKTRP